MPKYNEPKSYTLAKMSARNATVAIESATKSVFAKSFGKIKQ